MIRNPNDVRATMQSECLTQEEQRVEGAPASMALEGLRDARQLTQVQMAQLLKISQGAVSKVERRRDMFVSTLRNYVRAIGGDLQIRAVFPEGDVLIDQFSELDRSENGSSHTSVTKGNDHSRKGETATRSA